MWSCADRYIYLQFIYFSTYSSNVCVVTAHETVLLNSLCSCLPILAGMSEGGDKYGGIIGTYEWNSF